MHFLLLLLPFPPSHPSLIPGLGWEGKKGNRKGRNFHFAPLPPSLLTQKYARKISSALDFPLFPLENIYVCTYKNVVEYGGTLFSLIQRRPIMERGWE